MRMNIARSSEFREISAFGDTGNAPPRAYDEAMAIGGRSKVATAIGTVLVLAVLAVLVWAAWPFLPIVGEWLTDLFFGFFDWLRSLTTP